MFNLNAYINKTIEVEIGEDILHIKLPSSNQMAKITKLEQTIDSTDIEKLYESKPQIAHILINNNEEGKSFELDYIKQIPLTGLLEIIKVVTTAKIELETDPNSDSQSQAAK